MTNGEKIQTILDVNRDCTEVHGENGTMTFTVTQDFWDSEYKELTTKNDLGVDCISRTEVLKLIYDYKENHSENRKEYPINYGTLLDMIRWIRKLPSVTPQPMVVSIAEGKIDEDKFKELASRAVLTVTPQEPQIFKWCDTCKEYDQENHCCHRWSKVIRDTVEEMKQEPKTGHCRDCKWWKDSDGEYRRGVSAESQCPINRREVFDGNGYCFLFEPQESEEEK